jgi:pimeloyl-ACP methyl ester carboxylesterase
MRHWKAGIALLVLTAAGACATPPRGDRGIEIASQGVLYTGGAADGDHTIGQTYIFYQRPPATRAKAPRVPIIFIHGSRQTGAGFLGTPDGRPGWATFFLGQGWPVYVVDQPGRGKAGYFPQAYGAQEPWSSRKHVTERFSAPETLDPLPWPDADKHSQWPGGPGSGVPGQPAFEQFVASQVANMPDIAMQYALTLRGITDLLHRIGPAVIVTHSQSGPLSWMIAQANPGLVKAVIAVEPTGNAGSSGALGQTCGITNDCLDFTPAVHSPADLGLVRTPSRPGRVDCWLQREPRYRLPWLNGIPILIATGEASYHAASDHCTSAFLTQAGVANDFVYLPDVGIRGNGHMQMIEANNLEIAAFYERWLLAKLR